MFRIKTVSGRFDYDENNIEMFRDHVVRLLGARIQNTTGDNTWFALEQIKKGITTTLSIRLMYISLKGELIYAVQTVDSERKHIINAAINPDEWALM